MADFLVLPRPAECLLNEAGFHRDLNSLDLLNKKGWSPGHSESVVGKDAKAFFTERGKTIKPND